MAGESLYPDADGDGYGTPNGPQLACGADYRLPSGYGRAADCDDTDPTKFRAYNRDADGDGVGAGDETLCAGAETPPGYLIGIAINRTLPVDCDDTDPNLSTLYYQDLDGDGYAASTQVSVCGSPALGPPPGFGSFSPELADCDDSRTDVSPVALDQWTDSVDSDCDGQPVPAPYGYTCTSVETCDLAWFTAAIDSTCDAADLVVSADAQCYCGQCTWVAWISNRGMVPIISEYALTIESADRTVVFPIHDPLSPGAQYPYELPRGLVLSGPVRFSVTMAAPDCNPSNNTVTEWAGSGPCPV